MFTKGKIPPTTTNGRLGRGRGGRTKFTLARARVSSPPTALYTENSYDFHVKYRTILVDCTRYRIHSGRSLIYNATGICMYWPDIITL